ncbi:MAG: hypothetical protein K0Q57_952, partial [Gammaproteobacteria bacterium]|nr:hypothetical protein [Gammaproteobacteria bacterium]
VDEKDGRGWTALMRAAGKGHKGAIEVLLAALGYEEHSNWKRSQSLASSSYEPNEMILP